MKCIGLTSRKLCYIDLMSIGIRCPFFNDLVAFVQNLELCTFNLFLTCNVTLINRYITNYIVFHSYGAICCLGKLVVFIINKNVAIIINVKLYIIRISISIRCICFNKNIVLTNCKLIS